MAKTPDERRITTAAVLWWQRDHRVTPLRCGNDNHHQLLAPEDDGQHVILRCPDCGDEAPVPRYVIGVYKAAQHENQW